MRFDFDDAQAKLAECESVIVTDYFLSYLTTPSEFMEAARLAIFETYVRIHSTIELDTLAAKLHMTEAEGEKWVVDLIRSAALDAKIDSATRRVVMSVPAPSVFAQVIDKTRELTNRTRILAEQIGDAVNAATAAAGGPVEVVEEKKGGGGGYKGAHKTRD